MQEIGNSLFLKLTAVYGDLKGVDKTIADYFLNNDMDEDLSAVHVAEQIHVSLASISRFAQKMGYPGYREFKFAYDNFRKSKLSTDEVHHSVFKNYQRLLINNHNDVSRTQMERIAKDFTKYEKIFVYGTGSSGIVADEMQIRFMRLGINIQAVSDIHKLKMNKAIVDEDTLVVGISLSANDNILNALKEAKNKSSKTILITSNQKKEFRKYCDEILNISILENLDIGNVISPQFPILVSIDIIYAYILNSDEARYRLVMRQTLSQNRKI